jgi:cellulose synthase/poly-beta-1,6-N-acetylglucosamine synthase-like glycosyltransferase
MTAVTIIFWALLLLLFHSYFGYGLLLWVIQLFKRKEIFSIQQSLPKVAIVVAAYNEATILEEKINNILSLSYPSHLTEIIIVTDGSTDHSNKIVKQYLSVHLLFEPERKGKTHAINKAIEFTTAPYIIFTDANTLMNENAVENIVRHFSNKKVGAVSCEKKIIAFQVNEAISNVESIYWKYESAMKQLESNVHSVIGAAGELFCIKKELFVAFPDDTILDDFMLSAHVFKNNLRIVYEKNAFVTENPSRDLWEEAKRKIRIGAGAAQALVRLGFIPYKNLWLVFQYYSRRVIRWIVGPIALPTLLILNIILVDYFHLHSIYHIFLIAQIVFYVWALLGWFLHLFIPRSTFILVPFYFVFMNVCMLTGIIKQMLHKQTVHWHKASRNRL